MRQMLFAMLVCAAGLTSAQEMETRPYPKFEYSVGYSALGTSSFFINLGPNACCVSTTLDSHIGFESAVIRNLNRYAGIKGDFSGYFGHYNDEDAIPCNLPECTSPMQGYKSHWREFYFLGGPELKWRNHTRFAPFAHSLFGIGHATASFSTAGAAVAAAGTSTQTGFAMAYGGGLDVRVIRRMSIRFSADRGWTYGGKGQAGSSQTLDSARITLGVLLH